MVGPKRCSLYYELLEQDQTIKEIYQQQLIRLSDATEKKWPFIGQGSYKIIFMIMLNRTQQKLRKKLFSA